MLTRLSWFDFFHAVLRPLHALYILYKVRAADLSCQRSSRCPPLSDHPIHHNAG